MKIKTCVCVKNYYHYCYPGFLHKQAVCKKDLNLSTFNKNYIETSGSFKKGYKYEVFNQNDKFISITNNEGNKTIFSLTSTQGRKEKFLEYFFDYFYTISEILRIGLIL